MRNMIFKTLIASILGSFLVAPLAHADRQGGGTLMVAFPSVESNLTQWVRYKTHKTNVLNFEYSWYYDGRSQTSELYLTKEDISKLSPAIVKALLDSKLSLNWSEIVQQ